MNYSPTTALIINKLKRPKNVSSLTEQLSEGLPEYYLEIGEFKHIKATGDNKLINLRPIQSNSLDHLTSFLENRPGRKQQKTVLTFKSFIPHTILQVSQKENNKGAIWIHRSQEKTLYFHKTLGIPDGKILLPTLLFVYEQGLRVFAIKDETSFTPESPLYKAPFHNLTVESVCMGTAKYNLKTNYWEDWITAVENAFFLSKFTHFNDTNVIDGNLNTTLTHCITQKKPFPLEKLVQTSITLNDLKL